MTWSGDGPLPNPQLEQLAQELFRFKYPLIGFDNSFCASERNDCRRCALRVAGLTHWTLQNASERLTDELCHLLFGDDLNGSIVRVAVTDYAESVIEDAAKMFSGDRSESWKHVPEDEPDDSEIEVIKSEVH